MRILSLKEKAGKKIEFSEGFNIIQGNNDTGKSSLLKSIYYTFGADPSMHPKWDSANPISIIDFEYDSKKYTIMRNKNNISVFDSEHKLLNLSNSITKDFTPFFSELFNFKIDLTNHDNSKQQATPAYCLLPYYIDQDLSWIKNWNAFKNLSQFKKWRQDLVTFHTGIKPSEYYKLKNEKDKFTNEKKDLEQEQKILNTIYECAINDFKDMDFNINQDEFKKEMIRLMEDLNELRSSIDKSKEELKDFYNQKQVTNMQIDIAEKALDELNKDYNFCVDKLDHAVDCPICGANYENDFAERFSISKDEDKCLDLLQDLKRKLVYVDAKIDKAKENLFEKTDRSKDIEEVLKTKKEKITFSDFINYKGNQNLLTLINSQLDAIKDKIKDLLLKISEITKYLKNLESPQKTKQITTLYKNNMRSNLELLNVHNLSEEDYKKMDCQIKESGSDLPRALLGYYFSILDVISKNSSNSTFFPIVIDSPKQQDQDNINEKAILDFIQSKSPSDAQIIIGIVDIGDVKLKGKQIMLHEKYHLLNSSEYESCLKDYKILITVQNSQKVEIV